MWIFFVEKTEFPFFEFPYFRVLPNGTVTPPNSNLSLFLTFRPIWIVRGCEKWTERHSHLRLFQMGSFFVFDLCGDIKKCRSCYMEWYSRLRVIQIRSFWYLIWIIYPGTETFCGFVSVCRVLSYTSACPCTSIKEICLCTFGLFFFHSGALRCYLWDSKQQLWSILLSSTCNLVAINIERWISIIYPGERYLRLLFFCSSRNLFFFHVCTQWNSRHLNLFFETLHNVGQSFFDQHQHDAGNYTWDSLSTKR